ncbi:thioesterase [Gammaproteobacteria bacterium 42_54_T18]|nr:thioesterase [Gammaproteobacteria bacterium 42_54_T18]
MTAQAFDFETIRKMTTKSIPFAERAGIDLVEFKRGHVKMKIPLEPNKNHIGTMYAGALFTLAEIPGGAIFMSAFDMTKFFPIVAEMTIKYLKPATTDIYVEVSMSEEEIERITNEATENGKSTFILEKELKDENGVVVAITTGTYQARAHR